MREELNILNDFPPTSLAQWMAAVEKQLKGKPFEKALVKKTYEGIAIQPMYFKQDSESLPQVDTLPGVPPYLRGTSAAGHRVTPWRIAQQIAEPDSETVNAALRQDLTRGQNAINIRLDTATKDGRNPMDAPACDVGANGLSLATTDDLARMFDRIDLTQYPIQIDAGASVVAVAALMAGFCHFTDLPLSRLTGSITGDPIETLLSTGCLPMALDKSYDELADLTRWAIENAPLLKTIAVHGTPYRNGGGNAVQEIGFAVAAGVTFIQEMQDRGLPIDAICSRMQFHFAIGPDFFMEIAKFRAARMVWHHITEAFGARPDSRKMVIHADTLQYNKTRIDPWVNMLRVSTEAFSAIAGGCDSLHVGPFDEVICRPNLFSRRIARNVQILFREEAHFDKVIDPAGGSWYIENITLELAQKAWSLFQQVEAKGGIIAALESGFLQADIAETAAQRAKNVATRKDRIVGTNMYPNLSEKPVQSDSFDTAVFQKKRAEQIATFWKKTSNENRQTPLEALATAAQSKGAAGLMPKAVSAVLAGATLGEVTKALRTSCQEVRITPINLHRSAEPFEKLRRRSENHVERTGDTLKIFMANIGPLARHKPRSDFSIAFFNVAALDTIFNTGFDTPQQAVDAALASQARAVVICGTDDDYMETVVPITTGIKAADPAVFVIVAGYSPKYVEIFKASGVDEFIHLRANALAILEKLQQHLMDSKGVNK